MKNTNITCNIPVMDIKDRIKDARTKAGLNQSELARKIGTSPQTVQQWEQGKTSPRANKLYELSSVLGVTPEWLQFGKESMTYKITYHGDSDERNYIQPAHLVGDDEIEVNDSEEADLLRAFRQLTANQRTDLLKTALDVVAKNDDLLEQLLARKKA
jgi:transcriptional regulator with XRE-family HTH domain